MARNLYLFNLLLSIHFLLTEHASSRGLGLDTRDLKLHASQDPFNIRRHLHCHALHWGEVIHAGYHEDACCFKKKDFNFKNIRDIISVLLLYFFQLLLCLTICRFVDGIQLLTSNIVLLFFYDYVLWGLAMDYRQLFLRSATESNLQIVQFWSFLK